MKKTFDINRRSLKKKKPAKFTITVFLVIFIFIALIFLIRIGIFSELFTEYSPSFSYQAFRQINKGMPKMDVHRKLGEPLYTTGTNVSCDWYSRQKVAMAEIFGWVGVSVCYSVRDAVTETGFNSF